MGSMTLKVFKIANGFKTPSLFFSAFFLFRHPYNVTITKDDFKMARKHKETTGLMQRGLWDNCGRRWRDRLSKNMIDLLHFSNVKDCRLSLFL